MRSAICCVSLVLSSMLLLACGQSGALQMPNDPNYDKRAKYLLYKTATDKTQSPATEVPASEPTATP